MTDEEKAKMRFISVGEGLDIKRPGPLPDWKDIFRRIKEEKEKEEKDGGIHAEK